MVVEVIEQRLLVTPTIDLQLRPITLYTDEHLLLKDLIDLTLLQDVLVRQFLVDVHPATTEHSRTLQETHDLALRAEGRHAFEHESEVQQ
jgi:hypothetical protein